MLPIISKEKLDEIQKLKTSVITKDNICPIGLLFETEKDKVLDYPILYSVEYFETLKTKIREIIPNSMVVINNLVGKEPFVFVEYSPLEGYPQMELKISGKKCKWEKLENYGKRLYKFCEENKINVICQTDISIFNTQIQIY